ARRQHPSFPVGAWHRLGMGVVAVERRAARSAAPGARAAARQLSGLDHPRGPRAGSVRRGAAAGRPPHAAAGLRRPGRHRLAQPDAATGRSRRARRARAGPRVAGPQRHGTRTMTSTRWPLAAYTISIPHMTPEQAVTAVRDAGYAGIEWSV